MRQLVGRDERGSSVVEYALLMALIAVVCLLALQYLGQSVDSGVTTAASEVADA